MIFLTLGTQLPFDRLVKDFDQVAPEISEKIVAQIGYGNYKPKNFPTMNIMHPEEFEKNMREARVVLSHAGIGTLLNGLKYEKPLIVMARKAIYGEHRNDHQLATVAEISKIEGIYVVDSAADIINVLKKDSIKNLKKIGTPRRDELVNFLKQEISRGHS